MMMMMQDLPSCFMLANIQQFATSLLSLLLFLSYREVFDVLSNVSLFKVFTDMDPCTKLAASILRRPVMNLPNREDIDGAVCWCKVVHLSALKKQGAQGSIFRKRKEKFVSYCTLWMVHISNPQKSKTSIWWVRLYHTVRHLIFSQG